MKVLLVVRSPPLTDATTDPKRVIPSGPCIGITPVAGVVTVYVALAVCPPRSVALTIVPDVPLGTLNVQLNVPVEPVVKEPLVQVVIPLESKTSDASAVDTEKPVPDTFTDAPTAPEVGLTVIAGVVTLNVPLALWPPSSVAFTVVPDVPLGTLKVQLNAPVEPDAREPLVQVEIVSESNTSEVSAADTEKPVPDTFTVAPTGPVVGLSVIAGVVTMNFPVAVWPPTSVAFTVVPDVPLGTLNAQLNAPVPLVVREPLVQLEIVFVSNTSDVSAIDTEKPVPDTVTTAPIGPDVGLTVIAGVVTANVPLAVEPPVPVAFTVVPEVPLGTLNVQLNAPVAPVVKEPLVQLEIVFESKASDVSAVDAGKLVPETVTVAPTGPWPGVTVIAGVVAASVVVLALVLCGPSPPLVEAETVKQ